VLRGIALPRRWRLSHLLWLIVPFLIWLALRAVPLADIWATVSRLAWWEMLILTTINTLALLAFSGRWWAILRAQRVRIPYFMLSSYRLAAFAVSYFTPGPQLGGEPLQVLLLRRRHQVPDSTAAASVGLEKLIELVVNFTFLAVGLAVTVESLFTANGMSGGRAIALAVGLLALPLGYLLALRFNRLPLSGLADQLPGRFSRLADAIRTSEAEASHLCRTQPMSLVWALYFSLASWAILLFEYWLMIRFLGLPLTPAQVVGLITAARVATLLPMPASLGTLEASQMWMLGSMGFDPTIGLGLSLLIRGRDVAFGLLGLWWGGVLIGGERAASQRQRPTESKTIL
jgi:uncharacterized protein (TIRG00374 family)